MCTQAPAPGHISTRSGQIALRLPQRLPQPLMVLAPPPKGSQSSTMLSSGFTTGSRREMKMPTPCTQRSRHTSEELLAPGPEGGKPEINVPAGRVPWEASPLSLQMAVFSLCPPMALPLSVCVLTSSSSKDTRYTGRRPTLMTSLEPQYLFKDSMRKHNRTVRRNDEVLGLGLQPVKFTIFFSP